MSTAVLNPAARVQATLGQPAQLAAVRSMDRANRRDPVMPVHLPGGKPWQWPAARQEPSAAD
jgi:hypothetical protein